jgi:hypothetical protein
LIAYAIPTPAAVPGNKLSPAKSADDVLVNFLSSSDQRRRVT